ncbi:bacterial peptide chain release factor 3 (bRF-3) [Desulfotomaculum arcticum]|uniref:Peptide chain release factor 3 n=1 Tax=Desulfotruncus arcticus DSM 17038 TaxID=1121424 RepID=A0A1I2YWB7_9FIRM|nr:peptide chain release factor 3 [Desulfotruncus arcticus]SFH29559.1 bacterial peptide chain release factor 3 (bRF-3) [Desulfotomaculum arcticum] [Desulfotruncus arcticus DSM 17038]
MLQQPAPKNLNELVFEVSRRRTFAIISHPDAGKTTLTEKLLLYAGAVDLAGAVRARKNQHHATSDWMELEQQRGISITTAALQFDYMGYRINLLDTPGHQDFSEDTYRTLMVTDSAVMVLDSAKGIEPQTKKLFQVCRLRHTPILTFINKLDRPGQDPLGLLDEIEQTLGIGAVPMNWPIGNGPTFKGVYDLINKQVLLFERTEHGQRRAPVQVHDIHDSALAGLLGEIEYRQLVEETELLDAAGASFSREMFLAGEVTPVFFGSAINNFGLESFLRALIDFAPAPGPRASDQGMIEPDHQDFSGQIFKIQANMDPMHRDRVAFLRVCSGRFEKDMLLHHSRLGRKVRMPRAYRFFAREREIVEEAYPGDVVGLANPGLFNIGDTLCSGKLIKFDSIPRFQPEHFCILHNQQIAKYKQFNKGLEQLEEEGAIQVLFLRDSLRKEPILAAVGELQFDVVVARLKAEYGVDTSVERLPFSCARWVECGPGEENGIIWPMSSKLAQDRDERLVVLFQSEWNLNYCQEKNPGIVFKELG